MEKRKRKEVERFTATTAPLEAGQKELVIPEGSGLPLGESDYSKYTLTSIVHSNTLFVVVQHLNSYKGTDNLVRSMHRMLFPSCPVNKNSVKANLRQFKGFPKEDESFSANVKEKLEKLVNNDLKELCLMLGIERSGDKSSLVDRIHDFLQCPKSLRSHVSRVEEFVTT